MAYPNLNAELTRCGINYTQLAERMGYSRETVSRWMNGQNSMPVGVCFRIKEELFPSLTVDYLFSNEPIVADQR